MTPVKIFPEEAALLGRQVLNAPYLSGGKGYDFNEKSFQPPHAITSEGYYYKSQEMGTGLDCSGLVMWAYNRAYYGDTVIPWLKCVYGYPNSRGEAPIAYEGANRQYQYNSCAITREQLQPGDLLFLDTDRNGTADHAAMYVGDGQVVHAERVLFDIITKESLNTFLTRYSSYFLGFRRVIEAKKPDMIIIGKSPIDLVIVDPDGIVLTKDILEIPGMYYSEIDIDGDEHLNDIITIPYAKKGDYQITVVPEPDATLDDVYGLEIFDISHGDTSTVLAESVRVGDIPIQPYVFTSTIPEPTTLLLFATTGTLFLLSIRRHRF